MKGFNIFYLGRMKLSEYFRQEKSQKMPAHLKNELFSRIQKEKNWIEISTKIPSIIFFFASKRIMYTSLAALLVFIVFGWLLLDKTQVVDFGIFSVKQNSIPNGVFADYVAEIVEFNGEYSLERNGKIVLNSDKLNTIQDGDVVSIPEWTDLIFNLQDWTQAKIIWPAEFSITKTEKWYQISLFDGKFFRIYCPECKSNMEIITPDFSISQEKDQALDLHIAKEKNGEMLIKNDWDKIIVKTKNSENQIETKQVTTELLAINPDLDRINVLDDSDMMVLFMSKNNISATFSISTEDVEWPTIQKKEPENLIADQKFIQDNTGPEVVIWEVNNIIEVNEEDPLLEGLKEVISSNVEISWEIDESIASDLWLLFQWQQVPSTDQMQNLKTNLNSFFLMNIFESIYKDDKANQNISRLADRINSIASSFGYSDYANPDLLSIKDTIYNLKYKLEKDRYISPSYILQLEKVSKWCDELANPTQENWEDLESDLPVNLVLM